MRLLMTNLLATAVLLFGATSASAYSIYFAESGSSVSPNTSDNVTVNVFLDVGPGEAGVQLFSVSVFGDASVVSYDQGASSNASYLLYSPAAGATIASYLVPSQTPMQTWPVPPPGAVQVNVNFQETNLGTTLTTGNGIYLATLVFHVDSVQASSIALSFAGGGNIFRANDADVSGSVVLGAPVSIIPEPTTAVLVGLGLVGLGVAGRRRS